MVCGGSRVHWGRTCEFGKRLSSWFGDFAGPYVAQVCSIECCRRVAVCPSYNLQGCRGKTSIVHKAGSRRQPFRHDLLALRASETSRAVRETFGVQLCSEKQVSRARGGSRGERVVGERTMRPRSWCILHDAFLVLGCGGRPRSGNGDPTASFDGFGAGPGAPLRS
jgi:hypothetical protein